mmetsp:Transcript_107321/g.303421  ORF Transcript_107321/g.303421 Transcript_107321/m.303421 type:complete len:305 (-) Transcript_107321:650-1564(-)
MELVPEAGDFGQLQTLDGRDFGYREGILEVGRPQCPAPPPAEVAALLGHAVLDEQLLEVLPAPQSERVPLLGEVLPPVDVLRDDINSVRHLRHQLCRRLLVHELARSWARRPPRRPEVCLGHARRRPRLPRGVQAGADVVPPSLPEIRGHLLCLLLDRRGVLVFPRAAGRGGPQALEPGQLLVVLRRLVLGLPNHVPDHPCVADPGRGHADERRRVRVLRRSHGHLEHAVVVTRIVVIFHLSLQVRPQHGGAAAPPRRLGVLARCRLARDPALHRAPPRHGVLARRPWQTQRVLAQDGHVEPSP